MAKKKTSRKIKKNKKKQLKIKNYAIPITIFIIILAVALTLKFTVLNDEVVAYVNDKPVFLSDLEMRYDLYQGVYSKEELLNQTIMEELLLQEADTQEISISDEDFENMMELFIQSSGTTKEELMEQLNALEISYEEFEESTRQRMKINMLLESIIINVTVTEQEIKDYFDAIGKEQLGNLTYGDVEELINQTIINEKRNELFDEYVNELWDKAEIVIFDEYVKEKEEDVERKVELAKCLTEKGVKMYGATTCSACITQKNMFGTAIEFIDVVECDQEGQQECTDMAIKVTPTWIINNIKYDGVLSLEGLAELAGCEYS